MSPITELDVNLMKNVKFKENLVDLWIWKIMIWIRQLSKNLSKKKIKTKLQKNHQEMFKIELNQRNKSRVFLYKK